MEPKYVCGYEGAQGKIFDNIEDANKSLRVEFIESELKRVRGQIGAICSRAYSATFDGTTYDSRYYNSRRDHSYPPPETTIRSMIFDHPHILIDAAQKCYDLGLYTEKLEFELKHLTDYKPMVLVGLIG